MLGDAEGIGTIMDNDDRAGDQRRRRAWPGKATESIGVHR